MLQIVRPTKGFGRFPTTVNYDGGERQHDRESEMQRERAGDRPGIQHGGLLMAVGLAATSDSRGI